MSAAASGIAAQLVATLRGSAPERTKGGVRAGQARPGPIAGPWTRRATEGTAER